MKQKLIAGNWKMNGGLAANEALVHGVQQGLAQALGDKHAQVAVCVPSAYLSQVQQLVKGSGIDLGSQDVSAHEQGAFTGEISAVMLKDFAVRYAIVGHSERRQYHGESSALVAVKAVAALAAGLMPVVCVGETLAEREAGQVESVIASQLDPVIEKAARFVQNGQWSLVIAYEPVWAIGTGVTASPEQAQEVHAMIRARLNAMLGSDVAQSTRILYGGSVKPSNASEIFAKPDIDGGLIGGAALSADDFSGIIRAALG